MSENDVKAVDNKEPDIMKTDIRVVSYYSQILANKIKEYGSEIGSSRMSNTVRSIVSQFLNSHSGKNAIIK
jgi:hypothetical protein